MDLSFTKAMDAAGKVFQVPVACTKTDNKISVLIKKEDITGAAQVDILPQLSDTPYGRLFCRTYAASQLSYLF